MPIVLRLYYNTTIFYSRYFFKMLWPVTKSTFLKIENQTIVILKLFHEVLVEY